MTNINDYKISMFFKKIELLEEDSLSLRKKASKVIKISVYCWAKLISNLDWKQQLFCYFWKNYQRWESEILGNSWFTKKYPFYRIETNLFFSVYTSINTYFGFGSSFGRSKHTIHNLLWLDIAHKLLLWFALANYRTDYRSLIFLISLPKWTLSWTFS